MSLTSNQVAEKIETGEHDRFAHLIKRGGVGVMSEAFCGKRWVPAGRNFAPNLPYPNCPTCDEVNRGIPTD